MPEEEVKTRGRRVLNPRSANNTIANDFVNHPSFRREIVYFRNYDSFFYWTEGRYFRKLDSFEMKQLIVRFIETNYPKQGFTTSQVKDIIDLIKLKCLRVAKQEETQYIAFQDCLYNTRTFTTEVFDIERLVTWNLPYNLADLQMPTPIFDKFLQSSLVEYKDKTVPDFELINLLQEMMGFFMTDTFYATGAFFFYGMGSNGKSVLMDLLEKIFGDNYVSALSLSDFNKQFTMVDLINKRLNISREEDEKYVSAKMFKSIVTGESVRAEHKFGEGFKMRPTCKFLFSTNKLPTFDGFDYGLKRRLFLIPFHRQIKPEDQDKHLIEKLEAEIPGIIGWALEGAKRLQANNYVFSPSKASADLFLEFEEEMSSAIMFFNENYVIDDDFKTSKADVYEHYRGWLAENGKKGVLSKRKFNHELKENIEGFKDDLFGHEGLNSFRAYNCRRSDRDNRDVYKERKEDGIITDPEQVAQMLPGLV